MNPKNAVVYGRYLGRRFRDKAALIWILGGDRPVENDEQLATWRALAAGLDEGDGGRHLMSFHPTGTWDGYTAYNGPRNSSVYWQNDNWLDFNMIQTGHEFRDEPTYNTVERMQLRGPSGSVG
jgi:hypothetical protein